MSSTAPPVLPISNPQTTARTTSAGGGAIKAPANNLTFCAFINNLSTSLHHGLDQCRPWSELADRSTFSKPESSKATLRVRKNFSYFHTNYYVVVSLILAVSLLTVNVYQPFVILSRTFSDFETLALLSTFTVFVFFLTSVRSVLILILMLDAAVIFLHNAFCMSEDLFLDDQENSQAIGFLSFLHRCRHRRHHSHH
ncbi:hypothetical protein JHK84_027493 [Glycine max]|nr:hypothetical protein JHK84_027493 [Glycine max]